MSVLWKPIGPFDISTDPSSLPETVDNGNGFSTSMSRCENIDPARQGKAVTRAGSKKISLTPDTGAIDTDILHLVEMGGTRFEFGGGNIYVDEISVDSGLSALPFVSLLYQSYNSTIQNVFATNGVDKKRIEAGVSNEWGITAPALPTVAAGASTGLTGDYNAKISYCRKVGSTVVSESSLSPAGAAAVTLSDQSFSVTWAASTDSQVTHVRVYRTLADGEIYYHDQDVAVGTVTVDTDTADASLGSTGYTDHDRPPAGITALAGPNYSGTCFAAVGNKLYYCKPKQPEYWPALYYLDIGAPHDPLQAVAFWNGLTYAFTKYAVYSIQGTGADTFYSFLATAKTGTKNKNGVLVAPEGIYHVGADGIYLLTVGNDTNLSHTRFSPIFEGITTQGVAGVVDLFESWLIRWRNQIYFGYCGKLGDYGYCYDWEESDGYISGDGYHLTQTDATNSTEDMFTWEETFATATDTDPTTRGWVHDERPARALVFNPETGQASYFTWPFQIGAICIDQNVDRIIAADTLGYIWQLEDSSENTDGDTAISWEAESKEFTLQTRRHFPRWVKYDVDASDSDATVTGTLLLDGSSQQTHSLTSDRKSKRRLVATGNGRRMSIRISGSGPVEIYAVEAE